MDGVDLTKKEIIPEFQKLNDRIKRVNLVVGEVIKEINSKVVLMNLNDGEMPYPVERDEPASFVNSMNIEIEKYEYYGDQLKSILNKLSELI